MTVYKRCIVTRYFWPPAMDRIYLDHAATTPLDPRVLEAMLPYLRGNFGNASSVHGLGRAARVAVEESRERIAAHLGADPSEIIFTGGGTEAVNTALRGMLSRSRRSLVTSTVEHEAVLRTAGRLEAEGIAVARLRPGPEGAVTAEQVGVALNEDVGLVSLTYVNNEIGSITPLAAIASVCRSRGTPLHTDAVQAAAVMDLNVDVLGVDLMSLSGHKIYGPKGIGVLYVRSGRDLQPLIMGGAQERQRRGGTENVAAIAGMATALDLVASDRKAHADALLALRRRLESRLRKAFGAAFVFNTPVHTNAAPHILSIALLPADGEGLDGEMLLLNLDVEGVLVSAGSACSSGAVEPSHVLMELGRDRLTSLAAVRFSLGRSSTQEDIDTAVERLSGIVARMRGRREAMSVA